MCVRLACNKTCVAWRCLPACVASGMSQPYAVHLARKARNGALGRTPAVADNLPPRCSANQPSSCRVTTADCEGGGQHLTHSDVQQHSAHSNGGTHSRRNDQASNTSLFPGCRNHWQFGSTALSHGVRYGTAAKEHRLSSVGHNGPGGQICTAGVRYAYSALMWACQQREGHHWSWNTVHIIMASCACDGNRCDTTQTPDIRSSQRASQAWYSMQKQAGTSCSVRPCSICGRSHNLQAGNGCAHHTRRRRCTRFCVMAGFQKLPLSFHCHPLRLMRDP